MFKRVVTTYDTVFFLANKYEIHIGLKYYSDVFLQCYKSR